ncbi:MAG: hypothetical protein IKG61_00480, partial [Selenomonadaceae bacterium]|nr:hypothetical protein [Selenomonadaceae bacterium]
RRPLPFHRTFQIKFILNSVENLRARHWRRLMNFPSVKTSLEKFSSYSCPIPATATFPPNFSNKIYFKFGREFAGAALAAAYELSKREDFAGKIFVVLLPDTGDRYLSTELFK